MTTDTPGAGARIVTSASAWVDGLARTCVLLLGAVLAFFLVCVVVFNLSMRLDSIMKGLSWKLDAALLLMLIFAGLLVGPMLRARFALPLAATTAAAVLLGAAAVSLLVLKPAWVSDFGTMWGRAREFALVDFVMRDIYDQRVQLSLMPAVRLLGTSEWVVVALNLFCLGLTLFLGVAWSLRAAGRTAAVLFCLIFVSVPELLLALGIPTHDVWALPWIALSTLSVQEMLRQIEWRKITAWSIVAAVSMVLLQVQREIGHVALVAAVMTCLVIAAAELKAKFGYGATEARESSGYAANRVLVAMLAMTLSYFAGLALASSVNMFAETKDYQDLVHARTGGIVPSVSRGTYGDGRVFVDNFLETLDPLEREAFARDVMLSDLALQPTRRVPNALHRMKTLSYMGSQTYFYAPDLESRHPRIASGVARAVGWHAVTFSTLLILSLALLARSSSLRSYLFPLLFSATLLLGLALVGEVQPRYLIPVWFTGSLLITHLASRVTSPCYRTLGRCVTHIVFLALLVCAVWRLFVATYGNADGRMLDWSEADQAPSKGGAFAALVNDDRVDAMGALGLTLRLEETTGAAETEVDTRVCTENPGELEFFYYMPYQQEHAAGHFELSVLVDKESVWSVRLPEQAGVKHASVALPGVRCMEVAFRLSAAAGVPDISWVNASTTEVYFARISTLASSRPAQDEN